MFNCFKKNLFFSIISFSFLFFYCENNKKNSPNKKILSKNNNTINKLNKWNINSVCDCYKEGIKNLTEALELRESYKSLKRYNENKSDVIKVKTSIKKFRSIQNYCLQNYKRAMFENNCDTKEILKNKQKSLFELGIQTAKY